MPRKPINIFKSDGEQLWVMVKAAGINVFSLMWDGMPLTLFGKTPYMTVQEVIDWHEKELRETHGRSGDEEILKLAREALRKFRAGEMTDDKGNSVRPSVGRGV